MGTHLSMVSTTAGTSAKRMSDSGPRYLMLGSRMLVNRPSSPVPARSTCDVNQTQSRQAMSGKQTGGLRSADKLPSSHVAARSSCGSDQRPCCQSTTRRRRTWASSAWSAGVTSRQDSLLDISSRLSTMLNSFMTTKIEPYMPAAPRTFGDPDMQQPGRGVSGGSEDE